MSVSAHVLDAAHGVPARGMDLRLEREDGTLVGSGTTDADGRCPDLTDGLELEAGRYRMRFESGAWFARTDTPTFYPSVEVLFEVTDPDAHHHVPLLLSPYAYSTYRGS